MGFFDFFKKLFKPKKTLSTITYDEVIDSIVKMEKRQDECIAQIESNVEAEAQLKEKIKTTKDATLRMVYAKKIGALRNSSKRSLDRMAFAMANIDLFEMVKERIKDNSFFGNRDSLMSMLGDERQLNAWLSQSLGIQANAEDTLMRARERVAEAESMHDRPDAIYGANEDATDILAEVEREAGVEAEVSTPGSNSQANASK